MEKKEKERNIGFGQNFANNSGGSRIVWTPSKRVERMGKAEFEKVQSEGRKAATTRKLCDFPDICRVSFVVSLVEKSKKQTFRISFVATKEGSNRDGWIWIIQVLNH